MADKRIIVVGTGPAGVRAAETLVAAGLSPIVISEDQRDGGQIYRRQPDMFSRPPNALYGTETTRANELHTSFDHLTAKIDYSPGTLAWNIADGALHVSRKGKSRSLLFDALIICNGATDRLMPVPGWNQAGVFSLGGAQIALKAHACAIGKNPAFIGTGPLLYLVAAQYVKAGVELAAVLDTSPFYLGIRALPKLMARPGVLKKGFDLRRQLRSKSTKQLCGVRPVSINAGSNESIQSISIATQDGSEQTIACDSVALGYHLRPETQLADLAGCQFRFDTLTRQWVPETDKFGRTSCNGIYLAGDGCRVTGADGSEMAGRLAAHAALEDLGLPALDPLDVSVYQRSMARISRFADGLNTAFPWPSHLAGALPNDTVVCRCETITAGALRAGIELGGDPEVNRVKAFSRVGMGRCQGRYCGHAAAEIIAEAAGVDVRDVGRIRGQAPVKPLQISTKVSA